MNPLSDRLCNSNNLLDLLHGNPHIPGSIDVALELWWDIERDQGSDQAQLCLWNRDQGRIAEDLAISVPKNSLDKILAAVTNLCQNRLGYLFITIRVHVSFCFPS